jgi:exosortase/archaeosortase family protein
MYLINNLHRALSRYFDLRYLLRFILFFVPLYYFNLFFIGLVTPVNLYSPFLDHNLNYVEWFWSATMSFSNNLARLLGLNSYTIFPTHHLQVVNGTYLYVGIACLAIGIMIFWFSFIMAEKGSWKKKLTWCLGGIAGLWILNCVRIAFILMAFQYKWNAVTHMDHHTAFNRICYAIILGMMWLYYRSNKISKQQITATASGQKADWATSPT